MDLTNPKDLMLAAMLGGGEGLIEASERQGQQQATGCGRSRSVSLPANLDRYNHGCEAGTTKQRLESLSIEFPGGGDDVLQPALLPPGWRLEPTDHSMWSDLVDANGNKRGSMFYKAAFYNRSAFIRLEHRYTATSEFGEQNEAGRPIDENKYRRSCVVDNQTGEHLHESDWQPKPKGEGDEERAIWTAQDTADLAARTWLTEHYPDHDDPMAYWDAQPKLPADEGEMTGCTREDEEDFLRDKAIGQGYVPAECKLDGMLIMAIAKDGGDPCKGCYEDRGVCGGRPKR